MTCTTDSAACCCKNSTVGEGLSLTRPSCCNPEVETSNLGIAVLERTSGTQAPLSLTFQEAEAPKSPLFNDGDHAADLRFLARAPDRAPPSDIFLLHSVFLI